MKWLFRPIASKSILAAVIGSKLFTARGFTVVPTQLNPIGTTATDDVQLCHFNAAFFAFIALTSCETTSKSFFRSNGSRSVRSMKLIRAFHLLALQLVEFIKFSPLFSRFFLTQLLCRWPRTNTLFPMQLCLSRRKARPLNNRAVLKARNDRRRDDDALRRSSCHVMLT